MGSPHGYDAGLEFDELLGLSIDRGSGGIAPGIRLTNAATNLGQQSLFATAAVTLANVTTAQDIFTAGRVVTLQANTTYIFEAQFVLNQGGGAGNCNIQLSFVVSTALAAIGYQAYSLGLASDGTVGLGGSTVNGISVAAQTLLAATTANAVKVVEVLGSLKTGNAVTTIRPQVTYTVAPGAAPTTEAGGYMAFYPAVSQ